MFSKNISKSPPNTLLWQALEQGDKAMTGFHLATADVNAWEEHTHSPLHAALQNPKLHECVPLMVQLGANLHDVDEYHRTPLMWAVYHGLHQAVTLMLQFGTPLDGVDCDGNQVMDLIAEQDASMRQILEKPWFEQQLHLATKPVTPKRI